MRTRYGVSPWIDGVARRPDLPRLRGELTTDVVIIGGGLTGCATAQACAAAGMRTILIEAGRIGHGAAGRSAGMLLPDPGPAFRDVSQQHGLRAARHVFESWRRAALDGAALIRRLGIRCSLARYDALVVGWHEHEKTFQKELTARTGAGLEARDVPQRVLRRSTALDATVGMRLGDAFACDPYRACLGLLTAARKRGTKAFEQTRVTKVAFGRTGVEVRVGDAAHVQAQHVIVTTGVAGAEFKPLRRHFKPRESYLVLTEPVPLPVRRQLVAEDAIVRDLRTPPHRIRWTSDDRLLVGGADQDDPGDRQRAAVLVQRTGQLMYETLTMYPVISGLRPEFGWHLPYGETADGLMYIGPHRNYPHHLFALGGSGESVTGAFLASRILLRALRGEPEKGDDVFGWTR